MAISLELETLNLSTAHRGAKSARIPSSEPAGSFWTGEEAGSKAGLDKEPCWSFCWDARPASYSKGGSRLCGLGAAKATQRGDCASLQLCPRLQLHPTRTVRTLSCWWEITINLTFPLFLPIMKGTEQWPTQSLTKHISVPNPEQTSTHLADEPAGKWAN